ncbi:DUF485 domain-containing protein [Tepidibacillus fermentans]|uniref:Uncharacterized membrane protein (DUF485 family) n=1 Tax=Tepidibacillus fermentans TaxID=1281767 RepID=A0A4R3KDS9_9BACI|nr:DUF485 domain-containing protein [Tepidibacillus fermentans]TCS80801.1 uncharacterized membrane protein (DUF485 family) [Tepidibacillus fermentans]
MSVKKIEPSIEYTEVAQSAEFKQLMAKKKSFIIPLSLFFFIFYFTLPVMTAYSKVLNTPAIGAINWAWLYAFGQFIMTWTLITIYTKKAETFDQIVDQILRKTVGKG